MRASVRTRPCRCGGESGRQGVASVAFFSCKHGDAEPSGWGKDGGGLRVPLDLSAYGFPAGARISRSRSVPGRAAMAKASLAHTAVVVYNVEYGGCGRYLYSYTRPGVRRTTTTTTTTKTRTATTTTTHYYLTTKTIIACNKRAYHNILLLYDGIVSAAPCSSGARLPGIRRIEISTGNARHAAARGLAHRSIDRSIDD